MKLTSPFSIGMKIFSTQTNESRIWGEILYFEAICTRSFTSTFISLDTCHKEMLLNSHNNLVVKFSLMQQYSLVICSITNCKSPMILMLQAPRVTNNSKPIIKASYSTSLFEHSYKILNMKHVGSPQGETNNRPILAPFWCREPSK